MYNLFMRYINIYFNDTLLDDITKKIADYNVTNKDKLKVVIKSEEPEEILIFLGFYHDKNKYGLFVSEEDSVGFIFSLFKTFHNIPEEYCMFINENIELREDQTLKEVGINEFDLIIVQKKRVFG